MSIFAWFVDAPFRGVYAAAERADEPALTSIKPPSRAREHGFWRSAGGTAPPCWSTWTQRPRSGPRWHPRADIYRALIESTAFGTRVIIESFETAACRQHDRRGGRAARKNTMLMQIYADVTGREFRVIGSTQGPALGAMRAAVLRAHIPTSRRQLGRWASWDGSIADRRARAGL